MSTRADGVSDLRAMRHHPFTVARPFRDFTGFLSPARSRNYLTEATVVDFGTTVVRPLV